MLIYIFIIVIDMISCTSLDMTLHGLRSSLSCCPCSLSVRIPPIRSSIFVLLTATLVHGVLYLGTLSISTVVQAPLHWHTLASTVVHPCRYTGIYHRSSTLVHLPWYMQLYLGTPLSLRWYVPM